MEPAGDPFADLIEFFQSLTQYRHVWQVPVLAAALSMGLGVSLFLGKRLAHQKMDREKLRHLRKILFAGTSAVSLMVLRYYFGHGRHAPLLHMALALTLALAVARIGVYVLNYGVGSKRLVIVQTLFLRLVWVVFALHVTGFLDPVRDWLGGVDFRMGGTRMTLWQLLQGTLVISLLGVGALWLGSWLERRLGRAESLDPHVRVIVIKLTRGFLFFFAVLLALPLVGINATFLSVLGGALGVGLGFALQKVASNYVSGFILLMDRSVRMGDVITVEGRQGTVIRLDARCITLSGTDGTAFIVPNETFLTQTIINHSRMGKGVCHGLTIEVFYETDLVAVQALMEEAARRQDRILADPAPGAVVGKMTGHGFEVTLYYWIPDPGKSDSGLRSALMQEIRQGLRTAGIKVPLRDGAQAILP
ncbi:mechanosensitive ion channel domain-containing protein [Ferrovum sp.]|uniref:mechanosensitive ion channel family protein n=1 Tax=Ferrovum sp. TaxID=2609467 RepID=UPI00262701F0|nr:mechanosensitive ion channel domain-containing protein [Ferrovum sp.]